MSKHDPRVDEYIAKSADFAKPILNRVRKLVHAACPDVGVAINTNKATPIPASILDISAPPDVIAFRTLR